MAEFLAFFVLPPLACASAALWADRRGETRRLCVVAGALTAAAAVASFLAWYVSYRRASYTEAAGLTALLVPALPMLVAAAVVWWTRGVPGVVRVGLGGLVGAVVGPLVAALSHYWLSAYVPGLLGCCPL